MPRPSLNHPPSLSWQQRLAQLRGSTTEFDLRPYAAPLAEIKRYGKELTHNSDADLLARSRELIAEAREAWSQDAPPINGEHLEVLLPRAYALVCETAARTVAMRPFDVQMVAAVALHRGKVIEMQTGEGKTLAATLPAYLNALTSHGVHVLTFNDYLARRDAEWMGAIYRLLGLTVGWVQEGMTPEQRRAAYRADITYVTAKEAGFDFLRDLRCTTTTDLVHRPFHSALVDEADSILIDEARVPLVLAGSVEREAAAAVHLADLARRLEPGVDFTIEEYSRNVELTEQGYERVERELGCGNLLAEDNLALLTELNCALHAQTLLRRDVDYIVRDRHIELVDEFTGRVADDRNWPDGLQAALEAKEGLERGADGQILGSITLEHLLAGYSRLCGMTGTAQTAAEELFELYDLGVVVIPTHQPMIRDDQPDRIFTHHAAKLDSLVAEIERTHATGRPVLVGTLSVAESEHLASLLSVPCQVLNAKHDADEATVIANAGALGAVTISTNMAGRGTDIRLGGEDEADRDQVVALGGLYVIGTNRHESLRIDLQLRGRAGRQGDPGASCFFVCLEDPLLARYGIRDLIPPKLMPKEQLAAIENPIVRREVARAQRIIEGQNREIRRTLWRYATPIEDQRRKVHGKRQDLLLGSRPTGWRRQPQRYAELINAVGEAEVVRAETAITLFHIDRTWTEHLALVASLREGIHLVSLSGEDPLTVFQLKTAESFHNIQPQVDAAVLAALDRVVAQGRRLELNELGLEGPASTWTYIISDDPFRNQLGRMLTGPGNSTMAMAAAVMVGPLLILWGLVDRHYRKRARRNRD